ncbi:hypothetical protein [Streptomyces xanthii]|uniref:Uncharacterized protein n=1 Tax=Streptomyces xanthii TaxID=2768069 RepID=A0A7H1BGG6_9ACTN|nr:hypothetical protein [Streptomyces xanthii]QNS07821.1 hypothetical protein IAG42_32265 [Streptomyces xanthii]
MEDQVRGTWGLMMSCQHANPTGLYKQTRAEGHVTGTRAEAREALHRHVLAFDPARPAMPVRRVIYEDGEGYLVIIQGRTQTYQYEFKLCRVVLDSQPNAAPPAAPPMFSPPPPAAPPSAG